MIAIINTWLIVSIFIIIVIIVFLRGLFVTTERNKLKKIISETNKLNEKLDSELNERDIKNINFINNFFKSEDYLLEKEWDKYFEIIKNESENNKILSPAYFFDPQKIINQYSNRNLANSLPSLLTGLGILGTFMGLVVGLSGLGGVENLRDKIPVLIGGMRISFISSLTAILFSLIYTWLDKKIVSRVEQEITSLNEKFNKFLPVRIESDLLEQIAKNQEKQLQATNEFVTDTLIPEIVNGMQEAVDKSLTPKMEEMNNTVEKVAEATTDKQAESIDKMVNKFMDTFNESFDNQFNALQDTLEEMINWQKRNKKEMEELIETVEEGALRQNELLENTGDLLSNIESYLTKFDKLNQNLNQNVKSLNQLSSKLSSLEEKTNDKLELLIEHQDKFDEERSTYLENMQEQIKEINEFWSSIQNNFTELNNNLEGAMEQFADNTYEGLERTFDSFDENLSNISNRLAVTINELNEMVEQIPASFNQLRELLSEIDIERKELATTINKQQETIEENLSTYNEKLDSNMTRLKEDIISDLAEEMPNSNKELETAFKEFKGDHKELMSKLENKIVTYNENMEDNIKEAKEEIKEELKEENKGFFSNFRGE